jgi:hypothetical protein
MSVTQNSFKGYGYQDYVYLLCTVLMDTRSDISSISAEIGKDNHDFDDITIVADKKIYYFQMKNHKQFNEDKYELGTNYVKVNGKKSFFKEGEINVIVMQTSTLVNNDMLFGIPARKENDLYLISLSGDEIATFIDGQYADNLKRNIQIIHFAKSRIIDANYYVERGDLPRYSLLEHELKEKTVVIRKESLSVERGILYVVGKPGVGKSHFVNELENQLENMMLYRFWISSQDDMKKNRLNYDTFLLELRYRLYSNFRVCTEADIADELRSRNITLVIDGLDHVENYNSCELDKFFSFFEMLEGVKVIIFTRPLKHPVGARQYNLKNWDALQTYYFLAEKYKIQDAKICEKIYEMTDGYPILVNYSANYYKLYGKVQITEKITEVEEYYELLLSEADFLEALSVFSVTESYLTIEDIDIISGNSFISRTVSGFIRIYPYLFEKRFNRYSLLHDSFNTFFRKTVLKDEKLENEQNSFIDNVKNDLMFDHLRFMNRINAIEIGDAFKRDLLIRYSDFEKMKSLIENNLDIEAIAEFYEQLYIVLENQPETILTVQQYYAFVLIQKTMQRIQLDSCMDVLAEQIDYIYNIEQKYFSEVYSNRILFKIIDHFFYVQDQQIQIRENITKIKRTEGGEIFYKFLEQIEENRLYFEIEKKDSFDEVFGDMFWQQDENDIYKKLTETLVYYCVKERAFGNIGDTIKVILDGGLTDKNYKKYQEILSYCPLTKVSVNKVISAVRWKLYGLGCLQETNPYLCHSLAQNIIDIATKGWLDVYAVCQCYIRLAIYQGREIDILSLNRFYIMYMGEYDDSFMFLPDCLKIYEKHGFMTIKESIELVSKIESLCNGNVSMLERYINVSGKDEFESLLKCGILNKRYNVQIFDLETEIINMIPKEVIIKALYEYLRCYDYNKIIEKNNIINLINSKYADELNNLMSKYEYQFMPEVSQKGEYTYDSYFNRDYLIEEDLIQIKENKEDDLFIARYFDGYYRCFNNLEFFQHFEKEVLRNDFQKILYISMNAKKSIIERRGMLVCYLANIPIFADTIEFNECWDSFHSIFKQFISASLV